MSSITRWLQITRLTSTFTYEDCITCLRDLRVHLLETHFLETGRCIRHITPIQALVSATDLTEEERQIAEFTTTIYLSIL